ncbi:hypothetical protein ERICI_00517 [Paenibacillus larvae subsp. larvae]|nr:hypothetical protein ERICI_00517 [Paenibacillus larvae subsp. larvae]AVG11054.1 hypothetical protein ERICII_00617 [Paenibacillus larvae subsp. larvae DSM 25430]ETK28596.1 hypothetical protein ERIC1_1c20650 [Paenibacillus larvae subsp. larvae DSM 25719]AVF28300.1 hypothetical protein ERICIII_04236 [Paenibacillus larvae subsp. larvae]AVF32803.1 hypothetical protein ERICIV_03979 [Paenibacillus larvae subsp. larvae]
MEMIQLTYDVGLGGKNSNKSSVYFGSSTKELIAFVMHSVFLRSGGELNKIPSWFWKYVVVKTLCKVVIIIVSFW